MSFLRRAKGEIDQLSIVEWLEPGTALIGLFVDLVAILGLVGLLSVEPEPLDAVSSDLFLVWLGFAVFYSLAFLNSFVFRRYRRSSIARDYHVKKERLTTGEYKLTYATLLGVLPVQEAVERLALAAFTSAPFLCSFVVLLAEHEPRSSTTQRLMLSALMTIAAGMLVVPMVALASFGFDMILAALSTSTHQR